MSPEPPGSPFAAQTSAAQAASATNFPAEARADKVPGSPAGTESKPAGGTSSQAGAAGGPKSSIEPAVLLLDAAGKIVAAHPTCSALFGQNHTEMVGLHLKTFLKGASQNEMENLLQSQSAIDQGESKTTLNVSIQRKDGTELSARVTLKRLWRNSQFGWTATFQEHTPGSELPAPASVIARPNTLTGQAPPPVPTQSVQVTLPGVEERSQRPPSPPAVPAADHSEQVSKHEKDRAMLIQRIYTAESDLYEVRAELEKSDQVREALQKKLKEATAAKTELEQRLDELRKTQVVKDLEHAKAELLQQTNERKRIETELQEHQKAARSEAEKSAATLKERETRHTQLEEELSRTKHLREKIEQQQRQATAELERVKVELQQAATDKKRIETEFQEHQNTAKAAAEQNAYALKERQSRCVQLEGKLIKLRQSRDEIEQQQQQMTAEFERAKAELSEKSQEAQRLETERQRIEAERQRIEIELRQQQDSARTAADQSAIALKENERRRTQLEEELAGLRPVRRELQQQLNQSVEELERVKAELEQQSLERQSVEGELRRHKDSAKAAAEQSAVALKEKQDWCALLEEEMAGLRREGDELRQQLKQSAEGLEPVKAELEQQSQERQRIETERQAMEAELHRQQDAANTAAKQSAAALKEKEDHCAHLEEELAGLRPVCRELQRQLNQSVESLERAKAEWHEQEETARLAAGQSADALRENENRCHRLEEELAGLRPVCGELQQQLNQTVVELERFKGELQQESEERKRAESERQRIEAELREQLDAARSAADRTATALEEKTARCALLEEALIGLRRVRADLEQQHHEGIAELERIKADLRRQSAERDQLEAECRNLAAVKDSLNQELHRLLESRTEQPVESAATESRSVEPASPIELEKPRSVEPDVPDEPEDADPRPDEGQPFHLTAPDATEVFLAGDFTHWKEGAIPMRKSKDGNWTAFVKLPRGRYNYLFIVDNEWRGDPECPTSVINQFGGHNSVLEID
jgi:chromosome segregation ATPase